MKAVSFSEAGGYPANEDAFLVVAHPSDPECLLCAVADGQGGRSGAALAARLACATLVGVAGAMDLEALDHALTWEQILLRVDQVIADHPRAGLTTLVAFALWVGRIVGASNGDSAAVMLREGQPAYIFTDRQIKNPPMGSGNVAVVPFSATLAEPWSVLAMTDGVWKYGGWEAILGLDPRQDGQEVIDILVSRARLARAGQFQDDFTLLVVQSGACLPSSPVNGGEDA